jgi:hypothetical protein
VELPSRQPPRSRNALTGDYGGGILIEEKKGAFQERFDTRENFLDNFYLYASILSVKYWGYLSAAALLAFFLLPAARNSTTSAFSEVYALFHSFAKNADL